MHYLHLPGGVLCITPTFHGAFLSPSAYAFWGFVHHLQGVCA